MQIRRVETNSDFKKVEALAELNPSKEYDCTTRNFISVLKAVYTKPWHRIWIALEGDEAIGYLWASADMSTLYSAVYVGDLYVKNRHKGVLEALLNALGSWAYGGLKVKWIKFHSPHSERAWNRIMGRLNHGVTVRPVNYYVAEGAREWAE